MRDSNTELDDLEEQTKNGESIDAEDTEMGRMILERPEVHDVSLHLGHQCAIILVTFKTWTIPSDFAQQYHMDLVSASVVDPREGWRRMFNVGRDCYLQGRFVRGQVPRGARE